MLKHDKRRPRPLRFADRLLCFPRRRHRFAHRPQQRERAIATRGNIVDVYK